MSDIEAHPALAVPAREQLSFRFRASHVRFAIFIRHFGLRNIENARQAD
ncbi:MAG: hypothetical protein P8J37_03435 [Fuerstiella sp.]|nr:hypothetical protein [Fuerstiella sp.]